MPIDRQELIVCGSETLLLVEDQAALREMLTHILRSKGYTVLSATGGPDALRQMEQHDGEVHLLVTDVIMPEMRGSILAKALTARYPDLLVIYMSGYTDNALIESDLSAGEYGLSSETISTGPNAARHPRSAR